MFNQFIQILSEISFKFLLPLAVIGIIYLLIKLLLEVSKVGKKALEVSKKAEDVTVKVDKLSETIDNTNQIIDSIYTKQVSMITLQLSAVGKFLGINFLENANNNILGSVVSIISNR